MVKPLLISSLQDPNSMTPASANIVGRGVASHRSSILSIKWIPNTIEMDFKRQLWNIGPNTSKYYLKDIPNDNF